MFKNNARVLESIAKEFIDKKDKRYCQELLEILLKSYDQYFYKNKADENLKEDRYQYKLMLVDNLFKEPLDQLDQLFRDFIKAELTNAYQEKLTELKQQKINQNEIQFLKHYFSLNYNKQMKNWGQEQSNLACFLNSSEEINKFTNSLRKQFAEQLKKGSVLIPSNSSSNPQLHNNNNNNNNQPNIPAISNSYQQNSNYGQRGEQPDPTKTQQLNTTQNQFKNHPNNTVAPSTSQQGPQIIKDGNYFGGNQLDTQSNRNNLKPQQQGLSTSEMRKEGENQLNGGKLVSENKFSNIPIPPSFNPAAAVGQIIQPVNQFDPSSFQKKIVNNNNNNINNNTSSNSSSRSTTNMNNNTKSTGQSLNNLNIPKQPGVQDNFEIGQQKSNQPIVKNEIFPIQKPVENPLQPVNQANKGNQNVPIKPEIAQEKSEKLIINPTVQAPVIEQRKLLMRKIKQKAVPDQVSFSDLITFLSYPHIPEVFDLEAKLMGLEIEDRFSDLQATQLLVIPPQTNQELNQLSQVTNNTQNSQNPQRKPIENNKFTLLSSNAHSNTSLPPNNQSQIDQNQLLPKNTQVRKQDTSQNNNIPPQKQEQQRSIVGQSPGFNQQQQQQQPDTKKMIQENVVEMTPQQRFQTQQNRYQEPQHNNSNQFQGNLPQNKNVNNMNTNQGPINNFNSNNSNINVNKSNQQMRQPLPNQVSQLSDKKIAENLNNTQQNSNIRRNSQQINNQLNLQTNNQSSNINQTSLPKNNQLDPQIPVTRKNNEQSQQQYQQQINNQKQQQMQSQLQQQPQQRLNQMPAQRQNTLQQGLQKEIYSKEQLGQIKPIKQPNNNEQFFQKQVEGNYQQFQQKQQPNAPLDSNINSTVSASSSQNTHHLQYPQSSHGLGNMNQITSGDISSGNSYSQPQGNYNSRNNQGNNNSTSQSYNSQSQHLYQPSSTTSEINQNNTNLIQQRDQSGFIDSNQVNNQRQVANNNYLPASNQMKNPSNNKGNLVSQERINQQRLPNLNDQVSLHNPNQSSIINNQGTIIERQNYQFSREQNPEQINSQSGKQFQQQQQQFIEQSNNQKAYFNTQKTNNLGVSNYFEDPNQLQNSDYPQKQPQHGMQQSGYQQYGTPQSDMVRNTNQIGNGIDPFQNGFDDSINNTENTYHNNLQNSQIRQSNLSLGGGNYLAGEGSYLQSSQQQAVGDIVYNSQYNNQNINYLQEDDSMIIKSQTLQLNENQSMIGSIPEFNLGSHHKMSSDSRNTNAQVYNAPSSSSRFQSDLPAANPNDFIPYENNNFDNSIGQGIQPQVQGTDQQSFEYISANNNEVYLQQEQIPQHNIPLAQTPENNNGNLDNQQQYQYYPQSTTSDLPQNWQQEQQQQQQQQQQYVDGYTPQTVNAPQREEDIFAFPQTTDTYETDMYSNTHQTNRHQDVIPSKYEHSASQGQQRENGINNMNVSGVFSLSNSLKSNSLGDQNTANQIYNQQQNYAKNNFQTKQKPPGSSAINQLGYSHDNLEANKPNRIELIGDRWSNQSNNGNITYQNANNNNLEMNSFNTPQYQEERNIINNNNNNNNQDALSISQAFNQGVLMLNSSNGENQQNQNQLPSGNFYDYQQQSNQRNIMNSQQGATNQPEITNDNKFGYAQQTLPQSQSIQTSTNRPFQEYQHSSNLQSPSLNNRGGNQFSQPSMPSFNGQQATNFYGNMQNTAQTTSSSGGNISFLNYQRTSNDKVQVYRQNQDIENDSPEFKIINAAFQCGQYSKEYQDQIRKDIKQFKQVKQNIILEVQECLEDPTSFFININDEKHKSFGSLKIQVNSIQFKMVAFNHYKKAREALAGVTTTSKLIDLIKIWWKFEFGLENNKKNTSQNPQPTSVGSFSNAKC